jgi:hypothetical protein
MVGLGNILSALKNSKPVVRFFEGSVGNVARLFGMKPTPFNSALKLSLSSMQNIMNPKTITKTMNSIGNLSGPLNIAAAEKMFAGGVLSGKIQQVVQIANKYGVPPGFLTSVLALETGWGKSKAAKLYNNVSGSMDPKTGSMTFLKFKDVLESVEFTAKNLKKNYIDKGLTSVERIAAKYSPPGAANDPHGTNGGWPSLVKSIQSKLAAGAQQFVQNVISNPLQAARSLATNSINGVGSFFGNIGNQIAQTARQLVGLNSRALAPPETNGGRLACAWFVSKVFEPLGIKAKSLGVVDLVNQMKQLKPLGAKQVPANQIRAGDIVTIDRTPNGAGGSGEHIGIVSRVDLNPNGTIKYVELTHNSSSKGMAVTTSGATFPSYRQPGDAQLYAYYRLPDNLAKNTRKA